MIFALLLSSVLTFVQYNTENLFDSQHDSLKQDTEFLPEGARRWTRTKYWRKLNHISQAIISCGGDSTTWKLPDLVALCEVENDTVMRDLTRRSLLRKARYEYVMTSSPDVRGIDVALMYSPFSFKLLRSYPLRINVPPKHSPTRDILYACGRLVGGDTLHVFVVHAPSRRGGERVSRPFRLLVAGRLCQSVDSIRALSSDARIVVAGDFNDYSGDPAILKLAQNKLVDVSQQAMGTNGAQGTYKYRGSWGNLDHIFCTSSMLQRPPKTFINDSPFLLMPDSRYGGMQPRRNYNGYKYNNGFSDHLPLVVTFFIE